MMRKPIAKQTDVMMAVREQAEDIRLFQVDHASAVPRPSTVDQLHVEQEYDHLAQGQLDAWRAQAESAINADRQTKAATGLGHKVAVDHTLGHGVVVDAARQMAVDARQSLAPFVHRSPHAKVGYLGGLVMLFGGDVAGQAGAAAAYGEAWVTAIPQAIATGAAVVVAGKIGTEFRLWRDARRRATAGGPDGAERWAHLFTAQDGGEKVGKIIIGLGSLCGALVGAAIWGLRATVDPDPAAGLIYGCLSLALVAASTINSYFYADEIADHLDHLDAVYKREVARAQHLASAEAYVEHQKARAGIRSMRREFAARGRHAASYMKALKARILGNNPGVAGHGTPAVLTDGEESL